MEKGNSSVCGDSEVSEIETPSGQEQQQPRPSQRIDGIPSNRGDGADDSKVDGQNIDEGSDIFISLPNMPRRFGCSRCNRCRVRSKGAFYCRAQMLHLFAPGWQEEDQTKLWQIPRGFLKWLRNEGPLEGCSTDQEAYDRALEKPDVLDAFPWYSTVPVLENIDLPILPRRKSRIVEDENGGEAKKKEDPAEAINPSEAPPPPAQGRDKPKLRKGKKKATLVLEPVQKKTGSAAMPTSSSSSFSSSKGNGGDRTLPCETVNTGGARRNSTGASSAGSASGGRTARESWGGGSGGGGSSSRKDTRDSDSDGDGDEAEKEKVVGTGGGGNDKGDGPGGRHRGLDREAMGDLNEAPRGSSPRAKGSDDGFRGGNGSAHGHAQALAAAAGAPVAGVGRDHDLPQRAHDDKVDSIVKSGAAALPTGERFDGENGQQERAKEAATEVILRSVPSEEAGDEARGSVVGGYYGRADSPSRGGDCVEGVSGSTWKGIGSSAPRARSGSGIQGHQQQKEEEENDEEGKEDDDEEEKEDTEEKKRRGHPSPPPEITNGNGDGSSDLIEETRHDDEKEKEKVDHVRVQQAIAACESRRAERQRYLVKKHEERRRARGEEALVTRRKRRQEKRRRHTQEPPARKVREVVKVKTNKVSKDVKGRRAELAQRSAALARREQLAYWIKERPFLGKIPPQQANKRTPTPLVPQDLYRNALQEMQKLDERRQLSSATPTTTAAAPTPGAIDSSTLGLGWTPGGFGIGTAANTAATSAALAAWREETRQSLAEDWPAAAAAVTAAVAGAEAEAAGVDQTGSDTRAPQLSRLKSGSSWRQKDLRRYHDRNEHMVIVDKTRSTLKARVYYWTREIPTFVEQGGDILNAANEMPVDMSMIKATPDPEEWGTWVGRTLDNWKAIAPLTADDLPRNTMNSREPEDDESEDEDDSDNGSVGLPREASDDELARFVSRQQQRGASAAAGYGDRGGDADGNGDIESGDDGGSDDEGDSGTSNIATADDSTDDVTLEGDKTKTASGSGDDASEDSSSIRILCDTRSPGSSGVVGNDNSGGEGDTKQQRLDEERHKAPEKSPAPGASPRSVGSLTTKANPAERGEREGERNNAVVVSDTVVPSAAEIAITPSLAGSAACPSGEANETAQRASRSSPLLVSSASMEVPKPPAPAPSSVIAAEAAKALPAAVDTAGSDAGVNTTEAEGVSHTGLPEVEPKVAAVERTGPRKIEKVSSISCEKVSVSDKNKNKEVSVYDKDKDRDKDKEVYAPGEERPIYGGNNEAPATVQKDLSKEEGSGSVALTALSSKPWGVVEGVSARGAISVGSSRSVPDKKDPGAGGGGGGVGDGGGFRGEDGVEGNLERLCARMMRSTKHFKISGSERLPPGWSVERDEKTDKVQGYWCRWYTYRKAGKSLRFKNLRDVESFVNSDHPEAARHRMAIMTGKVQDETWRPLMADEKPLADPSTVGTGAALLSPVDGGSGGSAPREDKKSIRLSEFLDEAARHRMAIMTGKVQDETWRPLMADEKPLADPSTVGTGAALLSPVDGGSGGSAPREDKKSIRLSEFLDETLKAVVAKGALAGSALRSEREESPGELGGTSCGLEEEKRKKKRKMEVLSPSFQPQPRSQSQSEGGAKKTKLETKKPIADSSSPGWVGAGAVKGSAKASAVVKRGRGRPPGSKNKPKDNVGPGDVKAQGQKTGTGVVTPGSTAGARAKSPGSKAGSGFIPPGSTGVKKTKPVGAKTPESQKAGAGGKLSGPTGARPPGLMNTKTPGSTSAKARESDAGAGGKASRLTYVKTPGLTSVKIPGSGGVKVPGPTSVKTPRSASAETPASSSGAGKGSKASGSPGEKGLGSTIKVPGKTSVNISDSASAKASGSGGAKAPVKSREGTKSPGSPGEKGLGSTIKAPGKTGVNISDSASAKASGSGGAKAPVKSREGTKSPGSSSVAPGSRSAETPGSRNVETPGSTVGKTQGFAGAEASRPGGAKAKCSINLKVPCSTAVKTPGLTCVRGCDESAISKTPVLREGVISKAKDPKAGAGGNASRSKASSETSKTPDALGVTPEGSRATGSASIETPGPRGLSKNPTALTSIKTPTALTSIKTPTALTSIKTPTALTSIKTLASKGTEGEGKAGDKPAEEKVGQGSEGAGSKEVESLESRKATAAAEVPASSVSPCPDKDTAAPVSSGPTERKPPREDPRRQETPRASSKSEPSSPSGSDGDLVLEEAASTLSKEEGGRGRKCSDEQHGKPSCVLPDGKNGGSSDGWSDGDEVIGEVGVEVEKGADAKAGDGSKEVAAGRTITAVAKNTEGVGKGTEGHVGDERELRLPEPPGAGAGGEKKEVAYSRGGLSARLDRGGSMSDPAEVAKEGTCTPTARATNDGPVRRRKRRKSSGVVKPSSSSDGGGSGSRVSEEVKEGEMEEKRKQESTSSSKSEAGAAGGGGGVNENGGRKMGKNMMKRVLALAAGTILPTGKRKRKAASISGEARPTFPPAAAAGSAGRPSAASSREGVKSVRRRRSTDGSGGGARGADAGGGPSVARGGRDRGGASSGVSSRGGGASSGTVEGGGGGGGSSSSSSTSAAPLRQSSRAAAAAATAAMSGVFSSSS